MSFNAYMTKVNQYPMLENQDATPEELVKTHLKLVPSRAIKKRIFDKWFLDDVVQEGNLALLKSAEKFDPTFGIKFSSYAIPFIDLAILEASIQKDYPVKILTTKPLRKVFFNRWKYRIGEDQYDVERMSTELDVSIDDINDLLERTKINTCAIGYVDEYDGVELPKQPDQIVEEDQTDNLIKKNIRSAIECLTDKEREVIMSRFFNDEPQTYISIADRFGVSLQRIQQIEKRAKEKMKKTLGDVNQYF